MGLFDNFNSGHEHKGSHLKQAFEAAKATLNLSAEQEWKIKDIFSDLREERREIKDSDDDDMRDDLRGARQETRQKIMAVLNDEQKIILKKHLQALRRDQ
jgi:Spy/CpxP family protein refolding chaperone